MYKLWAYGIISGTVNININRRYVKIGKITFVIELKIKKQQPSLAQDYTFATF